MIDAITFLIVAMGIATVGLSAFVAYEFHGHGGHMCGDGRVLTVALKWQLIGEALIGLGTLCFAIAAHTNHLPIIPVWVQSFLRFVMFFATSVTTIHLWRVIDRLHGRS
jgi:hypothetical protein